MVERVSMKVGGGGGAYFASPRTNIEFIGSGCRMLDLALGGGWAESRIGNIIGDKSTGKTLLCIEASANFVRKYRRVFPKIKVRYRESEHAFDEPYAETIGMPLDYVDFGQRPLETVEDLFEDLTECVNRARRDRIPELYICDSLDALSDRATEVQHRRGRRGARLLDVAWWAASCHGHNQFAEEHTGEALACGWLVRIEGAA